MKLLLDIGNSRLKWALAHDGELRTTGWCPHQGRLPPELAQQWSQLASPDEVCAVSVAASELWEELVAWAGARWNLTPVWIRTPGKGGGVRVGYSQPETLGTDRWAAMAGAARRGMLPACVVDCGTAATLDAVDAAGTHLGGMIVPGLSTMRRSLNQQTHGLPSVGDGSVTPLALDTTTAI
ncbi:MAG: type III pantothenate kinase, partial [Ectothiorhodospiraceae bacterium]